MAEVFRRYVGLEFDAIASVSLGAVEGLVCFGDDDLERRVAGSRRRGYADAQAAYAPLCVKFSSATNLP